MVGVLSQESGKFYSITFQFYEVSGLKPSRGGCYRLASETSQTVFMGVLIIEESSTRGQAVQNTLERSGLDPVIVVESAELGFEMLNNRVFDLIVVGQHLQDGNGLSVIRAIRSHPLYESTPIVMTSMSNLSDDVLAAIHAGVDDYIVMPYYPAELAAKVARLLNQQEVRH